MPTFDLSCETLTLLAGAVSESFLQDAPPNLSERKQRKQAIADHLMKRHPQQFPQ